MASRSSRRDISRLDVEQAHARWSEAESLIEQGRRVVDRLFDQKGICLNDMREYSLANIPARLRHTPENIALTNKYNEASRRLKQLTRECERTMKALDTAYANVASRMAQFFKMVDALEEQMTRRRQRRDDEYRQWYRSLVPERKPPSPSPSPSGYYYAGTPFPGVHEYGYSKSGSDSRNSREPNDKSSESARRETSVRPDQSKKGLPSRQVVISWRKYAEECFANYSKIKVFPHPPVHGKQDDPAAWKQNLKSLFKSMMTLDLKKESNRWHPDRFSACEESKREGFRRCAHEVFVVLREMVDEGE